MGGIVPLDLATGHARVLQSKPLHHDPFAERHRRAHADAQHVWNVPKQRGRPPPADDDVSLLSKFEDFQSRIARKLLLVDFPALDDRRFALEIAMHGALLKVEALGEIVLDDLMMDHLKIQLVGNSLGDILAECAHLARHRDDYHDRLLALAEKLALPMSLDRVSLGRRTPGCDRLLPCPDCRADEWTSLSALGLVGGWPPVLP